MPPERLTTRILHPHDPSPSAEDIFSSALETLFTDDTQQSHGVPGQSVIYRSPRFGDVYLQIPVHPDQDVGRRLFAHYLWNAGVVVAEGIERASCEGVGTEGQGADGGVLGGRMRWDGRFWDVRGLDVLELGAGRSIDVACVRCCGVLRANSHEEVGYATNMHRLNHWVYNVTHIRRNLPFSDLARSLADFICFRVGSDRPSLVDICTIQCSNCRVH